MKYSGRGSFRSTPLSVFLVGIMCSGCVPAAIIQGQREHQLTQQLTLLDSGEPLTRNLVRVRWGRPKSSISLAGGGRLDLYRLYVSDAPYDPVAMGRMDWLYDIATLGLWRLPDLFRTRKGWNTCLLRYDSGGRLVEKRLWKMTNNDPSLLHRYAACLEQHERISSGDTEGPCDEVFEGLEERDFSSLYPHR